MKEPKDNSKKDPAEPKPIPQERSSEPQKDDNKKNG